ncbi:MAG TPA: acetyl-CoA carboxylase biotin carboxylase subunit [Firmicutes bacterium]|nr:acetyl-CoA carboxylase biotin carboxylase subunit [Bacillota bacterium]
MFERILIANRGEIALRVMRACRELGIKTVAIYSEADEDALHVRFADEAYCVGPGPVRQSYLNIPNIISTALIAGVDAVHPGYGLLAERAQFAEICETHGLKFIGPSSKTIELMGNKSAAKQVMRQAGVPVIPGGEGNVKNEKQALAVAEEIGYPVMIKAAAGGGGKGMRIATSPQELLRLWATASAEAEAAFGSPEVYIEKYIEEPRHIEIQIFADKDHNVFHLGERECSLQRRHQKVLEESPSPAVSPQLRRQMGEAAVKGAAAVDYTGAGTMEFLLDKDGRFYFIEMNTRIQVEHPVTEAVCGIDLVKEQILTAAGEAITFRPDKVKLKGHAIELRINAEDPAQGFLPSPGKIEFYHAPGGPGVRVDSHVYTGYVVPPYYDSLLAKLICHAPTREEAIKKAQAALEEFIIEGVATTIPFHKALLSHPLFRKGAVHTGFIQAHMNLQPEGGAGEGEK